MHPHPATRTHLREGGRKHLAVPIVAENRLPPVTAAHDVIKGTGIFEANGTRHGMRLFTRPDPVKTILHVCTDLYLGFSRSKARPKHRLLLGGGTVLPQE